MAFTAGIKKPAQMSNSNKSTFQKNSIDRLLTVTGYDVSKNIMFAKDDNDKQYEVFVNPEEVRRSNESIKAKGSAYSTSSWMGHSIDAKMEKAIRVGQKVVLQKSRTVSTDKTTNITKLEATRIVSVSNPEADKAFQGLITLNYRLDRDATNDVLVERVSRVQHWNPTGIDVNDENALVDLKNKVDEARKNYGAKIGEFTVTEPTIGVQFRTLRKTDRKYPYATDKTKDDIYEVIDTSNTFDWIPGPEDEEGKEIKSQAHPLTGDEMEDFVNGYCSYIEDKFADHLSDLKIEVCYYKAYPASKNDALLLTKGSPELDKHADKNPLYQLSHRKSYLDMEQTDMITGKNAAVNGIIQIGANKPVKVDGDWVEVPLYWVSKIHANNIRGHIHAFIRTSDGYKTEPHDNLKFIQEENMQNTKGNYSNNAQSQPAREESREEPVVTQSYEASAATSAVPPSTKLDDFDPFADDLATETQVAEPVAQQTQTRPPRFGAKRD